MRFFIESKLSARTGLSPEGYLICFDVCIGRTGEQVYGAEELPGVSADAQGEIRISRPEEEVFAPASMRSYEGKPVTLEHPAELVSPENWRQLAMGIAQNVRRSGDGLFADLMITDADAMQKIQSGEYREISCGYDAEYEKNGTGTGTQHSIVGNHIALVKAGRCGPRCAIKDSKRGKNMAGKKTLKDKLRQVFSRTLDEALEEVTEESGANPQKIEIEVKGLDNEAPPEKTADAGEGDVAAAIADLAKRFEAVESRLSALEASDKTVHEGMGDEEAATIDEALKAGDSDPDAPSKPTPPSTEDEDDPKAAATTDRARRALWQDTLHRAAIMAPGLRVPTFDSAKSRKSFADTLCGIKRRALDAAYATTDGARIISPWVGGAASIRTLDCLTVDAAFNAASDAMARANNRTLPFGDAASVANRGPLNPEQLNARASQYWDKRRGG